MTAPFRIASYNVLAEAYATRRLYPDVDPTTIAWQRRAPAIVRRAAALEADVVCLQEVEWFAWPELKAAFAAEGYRGVYAQKGRKRPDGCAVLHREGGSLRPVSAEALRYTDGVQDGGAAGPVESAAKAESSGHVALIADFAADAGIVRVAATHLRWQEATASAAAHIGYRQMRELLDHLDATRPAADATLVCGDLNVPPASAVVALLYERGYADAYAQAPQPTCNPGKRAQRIDFVFHRGPVRAAPLPLPRIAGSTPLPSDEEPSDHLPVAATLRWAAA